MSVDPKSGPESETPLPVTGAQYEIAAGDYQATITELGAGLRSLSYRGEPLIASYDADEVPPAGSGELLLPWPNRIDHGQYSFGGASYQLDLSEPSRDTAIHGLTRWATWDLVARADDEVELGLDLLGRPGYPFYLRLRARYRLSPQSGLDVTITAHNLGTRPAPYGTGSHPYLRAADGLVDEWQLELPAARWQPASDRGIPDGEPVDVSGTQYDFRTARAIGDTKLDTAFTDLTTDGGSRAWVRLTGRAVELALWAGHGYRWLQVFTGDPLGPQARRRALAVEPMTCPPNAFVSGKDLLTIEPGGRVTHQWGVTAKD
jgi:aldose 1-epimerase